MQRCSRFLALAVCLYSVNAVIGQEMSVSEKPTFDSATTLLFPFDESLAPQTQDKTLPAVKGQTQSVPGRFGSAATIAEGGIELPKVYNAIFDINHGSFEFFFKAPDSKWTLESHVFLINNLNACQPGYMRLWYWADDRSLRLDLHLAGDCGYITGAMPNDGQWHHIAVTWDCADGYCLYVDGVLHNKKTIAWTPIALPADAQTIVIAGSIGSGLIDEVRLSKTARKNPAIPAIVLAPVRQNARIENGQTRMTVGLAFTNQSDQVQTVSAEMVATDYFQTVHGKKAIDLALKPGQTENLLLDVPTDHAGPYLKLALNGVRTYGTKKEELADEKLVFVDVLTGPRVRLAINGEWDICDGDALKMTLPSPDAKWDKIELPHRDWTWNKVHTKWLRKRIVLPAAMQGKTIELKLSGVRFRADVFVNGQSIGGQDTDQMPFSVDITRAVKIGVENELLIAVTDWVSLVPPELKARYAEVGIFNTGPGGQPFIRPTGTMVSPAGIVDPIFIEATTPSVAIDQCYLTPSFRKSTLTVKTLVNNRSDAVKKVQLDFSMLDKDASVVSMQKEAVLKPGVNEIACVIPVDLSKITLWQIAKPFLYRFRTTLQTDGQTQDQMDTRFGFREFWADGPIFRLNGVPIRPVYTSTTPYQIPGMISTVTDWYPLKRYLGSCSNAYINLLRFHSKSFPILCYDAADEVGLMIVAEAIHTTIPCAYNWSDERLWKNFDEYYPRWVHREFNHPCVVIRSIENELGFLLPRSGPGTNVGSEQVVKRTRNGMRALGRLVKKLDPSRPIMYHGSGQNFYDVADIYNIHYPGIGGSHHALAPVSSRWITMAISLYGYPKWTWDHKKPLVIGEHDCCLTATPAYLSAIQGNDAYVEDWQTLAFETHWPISVENLRSDGVTIISPWNPLTPVIPFVDDKYPHVKLFKELLAPIVTFIRESRSGYFSGKQITRCLTTINDSPTAQNLTVTWQLALDNGTTVGPEKITFVLQPTEIKKNIIRLTLPTVASTVRGKLQVQTFADGQLKHTATRNFELFPDTLPKLNVSARYGWVGPQTDLWSKLGIPVKILDTQKIDLTDIDVLLIAADAASLKNLQPTIDAFANRGGRIVVFDPAATTGYLPVKIDPVKSEGPISYADDADPNKRITIAHPDSAVTRVFPRCPDHPILKDLTTDRLRFWREDHITADATFVKPADGTSRTIIDCGHAMDQAALLDIPIRTGTGQGLIVLNTLPVLDLFDDQPAARILLGNLLHYIDTYRPQAAKPLGILADRRSDMTRFLESLGVEFFCLTDRLDTIKDFSAYGAIAVEADDKNLQALARHRDAVDRYVRAGGVIWIHRPQFEHAAALNKILPFPVEIKRLVPYAPIRITNRDLSAGIVNESLFWARSYPPYCGPTDPRVANNRIVTGENKDVLVLADPEVMVSMIAGQGRWLIDEVTWDSEYGERKRAEDFIRPILTNLNLKLRAHQPQTQTVDPGYRAIDLTAFGNAPLVGGLWGSSELGIKKLPVGTQVFKDAKYTLIDPKANADKACVAFYSAKNNPSGAKEVVLPIDRKAAGVNLLITSLWTSSLGVKTPVLNVDIDYTDGARDVTTVCVGRDVQDWYQADPASAARHPAAVWTGPESPQPALYQFTWENPNPEKVVRSVTLRPANPDGFVVLFAASTLDRLPNGPAERFIVPGTQ